MLELIGYPYAGVFGVIILALDVWAIVSVIGSDASTLVKIAWCLAIVVLPIIGFVAWLAFGPRAVQ